MIALSAVVLGLSFKAGVPIWGAVAIAIVCGTALGSVNGWFVSKLKVHPMIVTLATYAAYRGVAEGISLAEPTSEFPAQFLALGQNSWYGVPYAGYIFIVLFAVLAIALGKTAFGRALFAIGHNETAARFSGIPANRIKFLIYALGGTMCGLAATIMVSRLNTAKADFAVGMELQVITAVVLGGANINGGRGNVIGLLLGVTLLHETNRFIEFHWMQNELKLVVGALLIGSLLVKRLLTPQAVQEDT
jgi:rhamnose transport system permease protein